MTTKKPAAKKTKTAKPSNAAPLAEDTSSTTVPVPKEPVKKSKKALSALPPPPAEGDRSREQDRLALKKKVRFFYDLQRLRLQTSGRLYKRPEGSTIDLHVYDVAVLEHRASDLQRAEADALTDIKDHLKTMPFYVQVLSDKETYKGVGPTMASVILSEFDIFREDNASQMWSFAGLAPVPASRCKNCCSVVVPASAADGSSTAFFKHEHKTTVKECNIALLAEDQVFVSGKAMKPTKGEKLPYNAFLKTKLVGVLGPVLIKCNSPWRQYYDNYKQRKTAAGWGRSDAHRHLAAIRYMVKQLLLKIWQDWRAFEGLTVRPPYQVEYLGHEHHPMKKPSPAAPKKPMLSQEEVQQMQVDAELSLLD